MSILDLPEDMFVHLSCFLDPVDLCRFSRTCKFIQRLLNSDRVWKFQCLKISGFDSDSEPEFVKAIESEYQTWSSSVNDLKPSSRFSPPPNSWKAFFPLCDSWKWMDDKDLPGCLAVTNKKLEVSRPSNEDINPMTFTSKPFSKYRNFIQIQVLGIGSWFRFGVTEGINKAQRNHGNLLGSQDPLQHGFNIGYSGTSMSFCSFNGLTKNENHHSTVQWTTGVHLSIHFDSLGDQHFRIYKEKDLVSEFWFKNFQPVLFPTIQISHTCHIRTVNQSCFLAKPVLPLISIRSFEEENKALIEMGFLDNEENQNALLISKGNIEQAVDILTKQK